ncbi:MAG: aminopeptidase [Clostridiales bacterium]|nr:aminopeptidase [Clostridiales bacterium]
MNYKQFYETSKEQAKERFVLVEERIAEIAKAPEVKVPFADYFKKTAEFLELLSSVYRKVENGDLANAELQQLEQQNKALYADILPENYETSYANPEYAVKTLGEEFGLLLNNVAVQIRSKIGKAFRGDLLQLTIAMELFVEIYNCFEGEEAPEKKEIQQDIYWYFHDYSEIFYEESLRRLLDSREDFETDIVMNSDLNDLRYLYCYGEHIGENEKKIAAFLNKMPEEQIQAMADTYTEGYRIGFETTGKDLSKKETVEIRYPIGFERMVRAAVCNFEKMKLKPTMRVSSVSPNKQYDYDQRENRAVYLDKAYVERCLEVRKTYLEEVKKMAAGFAGPAVIEVFGEEPFSPVSKKEAPKYNEKQQQLEVYERNMAGQMLNQYIKGEERSFTIIAYPIPAIGEKFEEIFSETVKINTLDYMLYRGIQQKIIDVLDTADKVHITGKGANKTDLYVNIWKLKDATKETAFENCVADVNIPVGEVFTSPVLEGTEGKLFVSQVYLNELNYRNLEIDFKDGMIADYTCTNFTDEAENKKYIKDNVLMHHETLPMGEFAIGTNTTAYRMARDYDIADKLPILIAEKTGPHFAVGDTCYSHEEDNVSYNPDGKAIVARENVFSAKRKTDIEKAYFNCHTDITIPYDELDKITAIRRDGSTVDIISDGRFVLEGTEELNLPLEP